MSDKEILEKAIQKAIDGGWNRYVGEPTGEIVNDVITGEIRTVFSYEKGPKYAIHILQIIFDHDFAKALWGEDYILPADEDKAWQHHLQQMVISPNPIEYLGENI